MKTLIRKGSKHLSLTLVVPVYNEEDSLVDIIPEYISFCEQNDFHLLFVNDGSSDRSKEILEMCNKNSHLQIIHHKVNRGYGGAIKTGIKATNTNYIITIDADGQHSLQDVLSLYSEIIEKDADMVVGCRSNNGHGSLYKKLGKLLIMGIAKILLPVRIKDLNSGLKIYDTNLAKKYIRFCPDTMAFSDFILFLFLNNKHLIEEIPISIREREKGKSKISVKSALDTIKEIINLTVLFHPMRIFLPISVTLMVLGFGWGIPFVLMGRGVSVAASLLIISGLLTFLIGLIAEQLAIIRKTISSD